MRARLVAVVLLSVIGVVLPAVPAHADDGAGGFIDDQGDPTATAEDGSPGSGSEGTGDGVDDGCTWIVLVEDDFEWAIYDGEGNRRYSETGRWLSQDCPLTDPGAVGGVIVVPEGAEVDVDALALEARESVPISAPPMATSPPADRELYTQVQTWLWVDEDWWTPYSASANAGRVSATVTARPVMTDWTMGDGGSTACAGPGVEWHRGMDDSETYCSYVYQRSSSGEAEGTYALSVTVEFEVTWESNVGSGGSLSAVTRSATRQVTVGEIQAIETG